MTNGLHEVIYAGTGQTLVHVPAVGVPAPAAFVLENLLESPESTDRVLAQGTATADGYEAVTNAPGGRGSSNPRALPIETPGAPVPGRAYVVSRPDGAAEVFRLGAVGDDYLEAEHPLSGGYPEGSAVAGVEQRAAVPDEVAADERLFERDPPLRISWTYEIGGRTVTVHEQVRLVRSNAGERYIGEVELVLREEWSELVQGLPGRPQIVRQLVRGASRFVSARLRAARISPDEFLAGAQGFELVLARVLLQLAELGHHPATREPEQFVEDRRREWVATWDSLVLGSPGRDVAEVGRRDQATASHSQRNGRLVRRA